MTEDVLLRSRGYGRVAVGSEALPRTDVLGCSVDALDMPATVERCLELIAADDHPIRHVSINAAKIVASSRDPRLANFIRRCDIVSADGQSVVWAARLLGRPLPERVAGIDLMWRLIEAAEQSGLSVYFLGARGNVLRRAVEEIRARHPDLRVAGFRDGYFSSSEAAYVAADIREAGADLVFIAMSSPRKEQWLDRYASESGVKFAMGVGGALDVVAGGRARAPRWMQRLGLEWLFRMMQEPARMSGRYLVGNARFLWLLGRQLLRGRVGRRR